MSTLVGDPLEEPMPLGAATVYLNLTLGEYLELEGAQWLYLKLFQRDAIEFCNPSFFLAADVSCCKRGFPPSLNT